MVAFLGLLFVIAIINWYFVFNDKVRRKHAALSYALYRMNREHRNMSDALGLALHLIVATTCTTLLVGILIVGVVQMFK